MRQADTEKYYYAMNKVGPKWIRNFTVQNCIDFIKAYYDEKTNCAGFALSCNVSNGYDIGIFFIERNKNE